MKVKLVERAKPGEPTNKKWYPNAVNAGKKDIKAIAKQIAGRSSLTRGDIENVLSNFVDELPTMLNDGFSVQLGEFGTIRLSLSGTGAETKEEFNVGSIKAKVLFTPSTGLKKELDEIHYETV